MLSIAIIIPVFNRREVTIHGLTNLCNSLAHYYRNGSNYLTFKIIVVDDGSTDGTSTAIAHRFPEMVILEGHGNLWWSGAINKGTLFAEQELRCSHVLFWNDDTFPSEDYFIKLEELLTAKPIYREAILVSKVFWSTEENLLFNFGCLYNPRTGKKKILGLNQPDSFQRITRVDWSGGMGTLVPIDILKSIDYLDNLNFPQYHGDIDFFLRAKEKGYSAYAIPTLKIFNNPATTGVSFTKKITDFSLLFKSNRSLLNFKQNYYFNKRHSGSILSWLNFVAFYLKIIAKSIYFSLVKNTP